MAPTRSFLQSTHRTRTANALCNHKFRAISATRSICILSDCDATRTHPDPTAAATKTTPASGVFVAQPIRPNPVLAVQRINLVGGYEDATVPYNLSASKADQVLDNLLEVAMRVGEDDGLLPELFTPVPKEKNRALMGPRDAARVRKMRKVVRPSSGIRIKKRYAAMKAALTRRTEWVASEDGLTWAARQGRMLPASKLRNEVSSEEAVLDEQMDFEEATNHQDVEMNDDIMGGYTEYDIQEDDVDLEVEGEREEEEGEEEETHEVIPASFDCRTARYNLRSRVAVDYRSAYKYAYAK